MHVRKHALGEAYVVAAGAILGLALFAHAVRAVAAGPVAVVIVLSGLVPAVALASARVWLPRTGLSGSQIWTVAMWCGLGIGLITLVNVAILASGRALGALAPVALAASVSIGAGAGFLTGSLLELRRGTRRLERTNDVLTRVLRHNFGNDLTVILGHLDELETAVSAENHDRVQRIQRKVDGLLTTTEKARQVDVALSADIDRRRAIDLVPQVRQAAAAVERAHPEATVTLDLPEHCYVRADWLLSTVVDNVIENAVVHAQGPPEINVRLRPVGDEIEFAVVDDCPQLPANERAAFEDGVESPLEHSTGVGLRLVQLLVESYGGSAHVEPVTDGGNELIVLLPRARYSGRVRGLRRALDGLAGPLGRLRDTLLAR